MKEKMTCADLMTSPKGPLLRLSLASWSEMTLSISSSKVCGCKIPFPWATYLRNQNFLSSQTQAQENENQRSRDQRRTWRAEKRARCGEPRECLRLGLWYWANDLAFESPWSNHPELWTSFFSLWLKRRRFSGWPCWRWRWSCESLLLLLLIFNYKIML